VSEKLIYGNIEFPIEWFSEELATEADEIIENKEAEI